MEGEGCGCWMCYGVLNVKAIQDVLEKTYFKFTHTHTKTVAQDI